MKQHCNYMVLVTYTFNSFFLLLRFISLPLYSYLSSLPPPPFGLSIFRFNSICSHQPPLLSCKLWMTSLWMKPRCCFMAKSKLLFVAVYWYCLVISKTRKQKKNRSLMTPVYDHHGMNYTNYTACSI